MNATSTDASRVTTTISQGEAIAMTTTDIIPAATTAMAVAGTENPNGTQRQHAWAVAKKEVTLHAIMDTMMEAGMNAVAKRMAGAAVDGATTTMATATVQAIAIATRDTATAVVKVNTEATTKDTHRALAADRSMRAASGTAAKKAGTTSAWAASRAKAEDRIATDQATKVADGKIAMVSAIPPAKETVHPIVAAAEAMAADGTAIPKVTPKQRAAGGPTGNY